MNLDKRLLRYLITLKLPLTLAGLLILVSGWATVLQAWLLSRVIDRLFLGHAPLSAVTPLLWLFAAAALARLTSQWRGQVMLSRVAARIKSRVRQELTGHLVRLGPVFAGGEHSGELKSTLTAGVEKLDAYFSEYLPQLLSAVMIPLLILFFVFPGDRLSGLIFLLTAPLIPFFMVLIGDTAGHLSRRQWNVLSRLNAGYVELIQGLTTLKILGCSRAQTAKIRRLTEEFRTVTFRVLRIAFLSSLTLELLATLSTAIIAVSIGLRLLYGRMPFEQALFILILAPEFYLPLRRLGSHFHAGLDGLSAAKRIFELLAEPPPVPAGRHAALSPDRGLEFDQVCYTYPRAAVPAVSEISFRLVPGQKIALVGPSGGGKSTIVALLLRFIEPDRGVLRTGGEPVAGSDPELWRRGITWAPQHPFLFHGTILENIRLADPTAGIEKVREAAHQAYLDGVIEMLPDGYATVIGERGLRLSSGQAQRLALARAFLKEAPLVILDEPTSALDSESERLVEMASAGLVRDKSVLTIAHRLHTVERCDRILFVEQGRIVESGSHRELLALDGRYAAFVKIAGALA